MTRANTASSDNGETGVSPRSTKSLRADSSAHRYSVERRPRRAHQFRNRVEARANQQRITAAPQLLQKRAPARVAAPNAKTGHERLHRKNLPLKADNHSRAERWLFRKQSTHFTVSILCLVAFALDCQQESRNRTTNCFRVSQIQIFTRPSHCNI